MNDKILCVDDDPNILEAYQRALRKQFHLETALGGSQALSAIAERGPYAVVVADMRMPDMNGVELLARIKEIAPDTVRMMLTGNADQQTALDAVNEGHIFRFMNKPCPPEVFAKALEAGIEQHRLITAERELLSSTLSGCVKLLTDMLGMLNPAALGRATRVRRVVQQLCSDLQVAPRWPVELAAMLSQIGCTTIPQETLTNIYRGENVSDAAWSAYQDHPRIGRELLVNIPRLEPVAEIVGYQEKLYNGCGIPSDYLRGEQIPQGSRILKVALDWDSLLLGGLAEDQALAKLCERQSHYDPAVIKALQKIHRIADVLAVRQVKVSDLEDGMILAEDVRSMRQTLLCAKGQEVTPAIRLCLKNYLVNVGLSAPVKVFVHLMPGEPCASERDR